MKRISTATRWQNLFGDGRDGFRDGDLANGFVATDFEASWCNGVQEELARVIEASGLALDGGNLAQLLAALSRPGVFQTPSATDSSTRAATTAFVAAMLGSMFQASNAQNGFFSFRPVSSLPALIFQWGTHVQVVTSDVPSDPVVFPIAFPNSVFAVLLTHIGSESALNLIVDQNTLTLASFRWKSTYSGNQRQFWFAIGS